MVNTSKYPETIKRIRINDLYADSMYLGSSVIGGGFVNTQGDVFYVNGNKTASGDGKSWDTAFKTFTEGLAALNSSSNKNSVLFVGEGYYIEASGLELSANDCTIVGVGNGADSNVLFGVKTTGSVDVAEADLLTITGNNNKIVNMGFYVNSDSYYAVVFDDTNGSSTASFNELIGCYWTREAVDGEKAGIYFKGGNYNRIEGCVFTAACKDGGIIFYSGEGNPSQNVIKNCEFSGIAYPIKIGAVAHNTLIDHNYFMTGSLTSDAMTAGIETTGAGVAYVLVTDNFTDLTDANLVVGTGSAVHEIDNHCTTE